MSPAPTDPPPTPPDEYDFAPMEVEPIPPATVYSPPGQYPVYTAPGGALGYGSVRTIARPGGLTGIGILSIIVGVLSLMASGTFGMWDYSMVLMSRLQRAFPPMRLPTPAPPVVPANVSAPFPSTGPTTAPSAANTVLTLSQESAVIRRITSLCGSLNLVQRRTILAQLRTPGQTLIVPQPGGLPVELQVKSAARRGDGSVVLTTQNTSGFSTIVIDRAGTITQSTTWSNGSMTMTTVSGGSTSTTGPTLKSFSPFGNRKLNETPAILAALMSAINALLAVFLIVAGILVLRSHPLGRRLHLIYAGLKIVAALLAAAATAWLWSEFMAVISAATPTGPTPGASSVAVFMLTIPALLGLIYPIVVLCVMESRSVREWYAEA